MKIKIMGFGLVFLSGFLLMFTILTYSDWQYEEDLIDNLSAEVKERCNTNDIGCLADTAMYYTHLLQDPMKTLFADKDFFSPKTLFTRSSFTNFYFGKGACGAYSSFFSRLMSGIGYRSKFVILNVGGREGGHISIVLEKGKKLLLVDPLSGHIFRDSLGNMTEIDTVSKYWYSYYAKHVPPNYEKPYDYQTGWKYTNWQKLGFVTKTVYKACAIFMGAEKAQNLSLRYYMMRLNLIMVILSATGFVASFVVAMRIYFRAVRS